MARGRVAESLAGSQLEVYPVDVINVHLARQYWCTPVRRMRGERYERLEVLRSLETLAEHRPLLVEPRLDPGAFELTLRATVGASGPRPVA